MNSNTENGKQTQRIWITGNKVNEHLEFQCSSPMGLSVNNFGKCLIIADPKRDDFLIYSDELGTLIIMKDSVCTKKVYTSSGSETTSSSINMSESECKAIKKKASEELERNRIYWEKWSKDFKKSMDENFPADFPFNNQQSNPASSGSSSVFSGNMFTTVPNAVNSFASWGTNLAKQTDFLSGFPFKAKRKS